MLNVRENVDTRFFGKGNSQQYFEKLYDILVESGPVYAQYQTSVFESEGHMVVVTGVDIDKGLVYTNNPWGYRGVQTYADFCKGFVGDKNTTESGYYLVYIYTAN